MTKQKAIIEIKVIMAYCDVFMYGIVYGIVIYIHVCICRNKRKGRDTLVYGSDVESNDETESGDETDSVKRNRESKDNREGKWNRERS